MTFNLDYQLLANDYIREDINLSFAYYQYLPAIKANKLQQQELLNQKFVCMVKAILLPIAIFWNHNFEFCIWHILNLIKKLGLKTKNAKNDIVKEWIGQIWANKIQTGLNKFFFNNFDWQYFTAIIFFNQK